MQRPVDPPPGGGVASPRSQSAGRVAGGYLIPPLCPQVPKPDLSEARSLLQFAVALAAAAALGCTGLVARADHLAPVWRQPGAAFAP